MGSLFLLQLAASFVIGGSFIAALSFVAERVPARVAGVILALPSTIALSYFFLGWATSSNAVAAVVPATFVALGWCVLFVACYVYCAKAAARLSPGKGVHILACFAVSTIGWAALAVPTAVVRWSNPWTGAAVYATLVLASHFLLHREGHEKPPPLSYTLGQKVGRAVFAGFIVVLVVFLGKTIDPFWGAVFAVFPAAFSATLMVIHWYYGPKALFPMAQELPVGSLSIFIFALTAMFVFPPLGYALGTLVAFSAGLAAGAISAALSRTWQA
ncbi:MAG: hypothetical protein HY748_00620 [Elusimicrobia bacterium]|nr:hypothetical protein [Elusimicrobiota bacterium]